MEPIAGILRPNSMLINRLKFFAVWSAFLVLMTGCSSNIPLDIRQQIENSPSVAQVREQFDTYVSKRVRWGGFILDTQNKAQGSWVTIIGLPLDDSGQPEISDNSDGRFIAEINEFLEPLVYSRDREMTVTGRVVRSEAIKVGEFMYEYPVIEVDHYHLWPKKTVPVNVDYPPYWRYDPWFYPDYYPWPYPYRLNPYYR